MFELPKFPVLVVSLGSIDLNGIAKKVALRNPQSIPSIEVFKSELMERAYISYIRQCYSAFLHQFRNGEISSEALNQHIAVLMEYAEALENNHLQHGTLQQDWNLDQGWHSWLNRMVTLGRNQKQPVVGLDPYSLSKLGDPADYARELLALICHYRKVKYIPGDVGTLGTIPCAEPEMRIRFGRRQSGELVFIYSRSSSGGNPMFSLKLVPLPTGSYRLAVTWHTGSQHPSATFGIEELIAKAQPFGPLEMSLPLMTSNMAEA